MADEIDGFLGDMESLAKHYIDMYFCDKTLPGGDPIPKEVLHDKRYVSLVLNSNVLTGMDTIYDLVGIEYDQKKMQYFECHGAVPEDVQYVISMLRDCSVRGIPKSFAVGILIMYLELSTIPTTGRGLVST